MDRETERQAGVAAETASLPPSPRTLQACAAQQVGTDRWHGLGALMDARCYGQVVGSSSLGAMGHHRSHLLLMCRIQEEAGTSASYEHSRILTTGRKSPACSKQPFQPHPHASCRYLSSSGTWALLPERPTAHTLHVLAQAALFTCKAFLNPHGDPTLNDHLAPGTAYHYHSMRGPLTHHWWPQPPPSL